MAAYGAVVSLKQDLELLLSSFRNFFESTLRIVQFLYDEVSLMESLLRDSLEENCNRETMTQFQNRIIDAAHQAADFIDLDDKSAVFVRFAPNEGILLETTTVDVENSVRSAVENRGMPKRVRMAGALIDWTILEKITEEITCINKELKKIDDDRKVLETAVTLNLEGPAFSTGNSSNLLNPSHRSPNEDGKLVGLEKDLEAMLDCLTGVPLQLQVFPVIGMGGIGKTTFAKKLYDHPLVMHQFYIRAWVTVSQEYQLKEILLGLLSCITDVSDEIYERSNEQLTEQMYRSLKGKRYLIVLDDIWDNRAWDDLKRAFPEDKNGSRIMLTSRLRDVSTHSSPNVPPHCLRCLNLEESWELLCSKIFANGSCPLELVPVGKQIAHECQGLPLAIVVVGGLLSKMIKTSKVWEEVAQNVGSLVMEDPQHCHNILALSYNHLPNPLKACFLYMGLFPEDYEISCKKLICLWIAEGFVQPDRQKTLEEVAEGYLKDLIARSLIMVKKKTSNGGIKTCRIHDLMRELCLRESQKESFLHVIHGYGQMSVRNTTGLLLEGDPRNLRRLAFSSNIRKYMKLRASFQFTRSFFCFEALRPIDLKGCSGIFFKLLEVLDIMHVNLLSLPLGILVLPRLKFLALTIQRSFCISELFKLQSLQTCIVDCEWGGHLSSGFWDMTELRHLHLKRRSPSHQRICFGIEDLDFYKIKALKVLQNLQSLSTLAPQICTMVILPYMCNLKKLGVYETEQDQCRGWFINLSCLKQLETLKYVFSNPFASSLVKPKRLPSCTFFPQKLMKLTLSGTAFPWEDMLQLSKLPNLEVLKLKNYAFSGATWKLGEGSFNCLKFLLIGSTNLELWEADASHFPSLQHLVLRHCRSLKQIPYSVGEAPLLEKIELHCCRDSAAASARQLQEEQQSLGNDWLTVYITES